MRSWRRALRRATVPGRLLLVVALLAGVLAMHGLADLLPATAGPVATEVAGPVATEGVAATHAHHAVADLGSAGHALPGAPASPAPGPDHVHDALVGCVLALVGVAALVVAAAVLRGRGVPVAVHRRGQGRRAPAPLRRLLDPGPPLLLTLCVQRV